MTSATRVRSSYRAFAVTVAKRRMLGPNFTRITLSGDDLYLCGDTCLDQRVKLIFPPSQMLDQINDRLSDPNFDWHAWWLQMDNHERPPMRTYTARAVWQDLSEVDIDFACHGPKGPASRFALTAVAGDRLVLVGPDRTVPESAEHGIAWRPGEATEVILAGDETAVPAICGIIESLPNHIVGRAFLEVVSADDIQQVDTASQVQLTWLPRGGQAVGSRLVEAVYSWAGNGRRASAVDSYKQLSAPKDSDLWDEADAGTAGLPYVWLAGEAGVITGLRKGLAHRIGAKGTLSFMGYWKSGRAAQS
jgi:NADPH-dependent ferric siderophore reductase